MNGAARRDPRPRDRPWPVFEIPPMMPVSISSALSKKVLPAPSTGFDLAPGWVTADDAVALADIRFSIVPTIVGGAYNKESKSKKGDKK